MEIAQSSSKIIQFNALRTGSLTTWCWSLEWVVTWNYQGPSFQEPYRLISSSVGFLWYPTKPSDIFGRFLRILLSICETGFEEFCCFPLSFCSPQLTSTCFSTLKIGYAMPKSNVDFSFPCYEDCYFVVYHGLLQQHDWSGFKSRELDFVLRLILANFASKIEWLRMIETQENWPTPQRFSLNFGSINFG